MQPKLEDCTVTVKVINDAHHTYYTKDGQFVAKYVKTDNAEYWYNANGKRHRIDEPAMILYENGQKTKECWCRDGKRHRNDGPAEIFYKYDQIYREFWYRNGKRHRDDGPAGIWYKDGQKIIESWWRGGKRHRDDGPARIWYKDGKKIIESWWRGGKLDGNVLAYVWLADINYYRLESYVPGRKISTLDEFRNAVKGPLALELMRPLPIPIRDAIYEHYCLQ